MKFNPAAQEGGVYGRKSFFISFRMLLRNLFVAAMEEDGLAKARRVVAEAKEGLAEQRPTTNDSTVVPSR